MSQKDHERLRVAIAEFAPEATPLDGLCKASVGILGVSSAALILMSEEEAGALIVASHENVAAVEELQFTLGEGPCLYAHETGTPVFASDLEAYRTRWPMFVQEATGLGVEAVFVFPLQIGVINLGVLYLCQKHPGMLTRDQLADGFELADLASRLLLDMQMQAGDGALGSGLDVGWSNRAVVHQATGMTAAQLDIALSEALVRLRSFAFATERSIYEVSRGVVARSIEVPR